METDPGSGCTYHRALEEPPVLCVASPGKNKNFDAPLGLMLVMHTKRPLEGYKYDVPTAMVEPTTRD